MSIVDPNAPKTTPASRQAAPAAAPKPISRPTGGANGVAQSPQLKRKASGPVESSQVKLPRKDSSGQTVQGNVAGRPMATLGAARPTPPPSLTTVPYRGTAAPAGARVASPVIRKPISEACPTNCRVIININSLCGPEEGLSGSTAESKREGCNQACCPSSTKWTNQDSDQKGTLGVEG
jgi:hypothetical protein